MYQNIYIFYSKIDLTNDEFFSLSNDDICSLLKNHQTFFVDFIDKFSFEKGKMAEKRLKRNNSVEEMEFDFADDIIKENYLLKHTHENIENKVSNTSINIPQVKDLTNVPLTLNSLEWNPSVPLAFSETQADPELSGH